MKMIFSFTIIINITITIITIIIIMLMIMKRIASLSSIEKKEEREYLG